MSLLESEGNASHNHFEPYNVTAFPSNTSLPEWQDILYATRQDDGEQSRYISLYMNQFLDPEVMTIGINASAYHSLPTAINLANSFIAQSINANVSNFSTDSYIRTASHPFPRTASMDAILNSVTAFFVAITLAVGLIFVPAAYVALLVDEVCLCCFSFLARDLNAYCPMISVSADQDGEAPAVGVWDGRDLVLDGQLPV